MGEYILNEKEQKHLTYLEKAFAEILQSYLQNCAKNETQVNWIIAQLFVPDEDVYDLVQYVIMHLNFRRKIEVLKSLLRKRQPKIYKKHLADLDSFIRIYDKRNILAHSYINVLDSEVKKLNKKRISYRNMGKSFTQPLYLRIEDAQEDIQELLRISNELFDIQSAVLKSKHNI